MEIQGLEKHSASPPAPLDDLTLADALVVLSHDTQETLLPQNRSYNMYLCFLVENSLRTLIKKSRSTSSLKVAAN